eukprot:scaffold6417_cov87-Cyclotella_meneghiniana.AAC.4
MAKYGAIQDEDNAAAFRGNSSSGNNEINGHEGLISTRSDGSLLAASSHLNDVLGNPSKEDDQHDPNEALFYDDQLVNHFTNDPIESVKTWSNRYYKSTKYYKGPGSPIFVVGGGEGSLEKMLYPFIEEHLAPRFGAAVIEIEHRFYGPYQPITGRDATVEELLELLTPQQAMADMIHLTRHFKEELGCGEEYYTRDSSTDQYVYYDIVTETAESMSKGCAKAVRETLEDASEDILKAESVKDAIESMNMWCHDSPLEKVGKFFALVGTNEEFEEEYPQLIGEEEIPCFDLSIFLPDGENARITTRQIGVDPVGGMTVTNGTFNCVPPSLTPIGFSSESMFSKRHWTYEALTEYCQSRYGKEVVPQPYALVDEIGFDDLVKADASRILFTNGLKDMWSGGSYLENVSDSILALNFENGAHHSDLTHVGPSDMDTDDIRRGFVQITNILQGWLDEIKAESNTI